MEYSEQENYKYVDESTFILENGIEKPLSETRNVKYIELENKLRVLLISDKTTDTSLASMCVGVGSVYEPEDAMGLAHFVEHLLFMGTEKHPNENEYGKFIDGHNGYDNAYTDSEETNYYFDISNEYYQEALQLFSEFFICPLFNEDSLTRERQAVHSEYVMNIQNDGWRTQRMIQVACNSQHPFSRFTVGTETTLSAPNIRDRALEFYKKYYSANLMTLVLLSNSDLDQLESYAKRFFSAVPNFNAVPPSLSTEVLDKKSVGVVYKIVSVNDEKTLKLRWILPTVRGHFLEGETHIISHILGHEAAGSLASYLKANNYITSLTTECSENLTFMSMFNIRLTLTNYGFEHYQDIIHFIYQYISLLKRDGVPEELYREENAIANVKFSYMDKDNDTDYVASLASILQHIPYRYILHEEQVYRHYSKSSIMDYVNKLTVDNMIIQLSCKDFELPSFEVEPFYDVHYYREPIQESVIDQWIHATPNPVFYLPSKNPFIPKDLGIIEENKNGDEREIPIHVVDTPQISLYLKNTTPYNVPKMCLSLLINSIYADNTPKNAMKSLLLLKYAHHEINEFLYYAELADCNYSFDTNKGHGIVVNASGFHDHIPLVVSTFLHALRNVTISEQIAKDIHQDTINKLKNKRTAPVYRQLYRSIDSLLYGKWTVEECLEGIQGITLEDIKEHAKTLFENCRIEGLLTGNVASETVSTYTKIIEEKLHPSGVQLDEEGNRHNVIEVHLAKVPEGKKYVYNPLNYNENEANCGCALYMTVCSSKDMVTAVKCRLFEELVKNEIFDVLRTKEQLGYVVWCLNYSVHGYTGLLSIVQSDNQASGYVYSRLIEFYKNVSTYLEEMDDEEFDEYKESLYNHFIEKINNVGDLHSHYVKEINYNAYNFDRSKKYAEIVLKITKQEIIDFYNQYVNPDSPSIRYLVYLLNSQKLGKETIPEDPNVVYIDNLTEFRSKRDVFPLGYMSQ